jgi:hypothetical protein
VDPYSYEAWLGALAKADAGATLLVSKGNNTRYSGLLDATGNEVDFFCQQARGVKFKLKDFPGKTIDAWCNTTTVVTPKRSEVLGADAEGRAMVTACRRGKGNVVYCNFPIESDSLYRSDCFYGANPNPRYLVYRKAAEIAGITRKVVKGSPNVGFTEHRLADGRTVVVAVNYDPAPVACPVKLSGTVERIWNGELKDGVLKLAANDAAVFVVK